MQDAGYNTCTMLCDNSCWPWLLQGAVSSTAEAALLIGVVPVTIQSSHPVTSTVLEHWPHAGATPLVTRSTFAYDDTLTCGDDAFYIELEGTSYAAVADEAALVADVGHNILPADPVMLEGTLRVCCPTSATRAASSAMAA